MPVQDEALRQEFGLVHTEDSGARLLVSDDRFGETARRVGAPAVVSAGEELEGGLASASDAPLPLDGPAGGTMIYTSGTTGRPKGVKRTRPANLGAALETQKALGGAIGLDGSGPHLITGPMYHAAPLLFAVYDQAAGAPLVILPRWDAEACLEVLRRVLDALDGARIAYCHWKSNEHVGPAARGETDLDILVDRQQAEYAEADH